LRRRRRVQWDGILLRSRFGSGWRSRLGSWFRSSGRSWLRRWICRIVLLVDGLYRL
jgi:hypothetical protein